MVRCSIFLSYLLQPDLLKESPEVGSQLWGCDLLDLFESIEVADGELSRYVSFN